MTDRELMQQALDALENNWLGTPRREVGEALRARLAQPEQDSGWRHVDRLLKTIRYLQGIAERGEGRTMREDESVEQFLLGYVKRLEAQPEQDPVAWVAYENGEKHGIDFDEDDIAKLPIGTMLYTAPPQREWQGLTDEEIENCFEMSMFGTCRAIEAKLKEKNT